MSREILLVELQVKSGPNTPPPLPSPISVWRFKIKVNIGPQFVCKDDNFQENGGKQWRARAVMILSFPLFRSWQEFCDDRSHDHNRPVLIVVFCRVGLLVSIVDIVS